MQLSIPSWRRVARFLVAFYAATALLFFGFFAVMGMFGDLPLWTALTAAVWPTALVVHEITAALLLIGLAFALMEPKATEIGKQVQFSLPSRDRTSRFLVVFTLVFSVTNSALSLQGFQSAWFYTLLAATLGLVAATVEPRVTGVVK